MAITNFIPAVWSEHLMQDLERQYVGVAHCSRDYEGEIKEKGNVVKICGIGSVTVSNYLKDTNMNAPDALSANVQELLIDQAKYFNFQIDDVDRVQSNPALMNTALKKAANALATQADRYVYSLVSKAGITTNKDVYNGNQIIDTILDMRTLMMERHVIDPEDVVIEVSPAIATMILKAKLNLASDNYSTLEKGCIGNLFGCKIYVSNNIVQVEDEGFTTHKCVMRTKRAIAFAEQLSEIEAYRPELRFADAVKGLHLYGAKVVYAGELVSLNFNVYEDGSAFEE